MALLILVAWTLKWSRQELAINRAVTENLLDRIQAGDIKTYAQLKSINEPSVATQQYVPHDDFSEAQKIAALTGLGDEMYVDDDAADAFADGFGIEIRRERQQRIQGPE